MKFINECIRQKRPVVIAFDNMVQDEEIGIADMIVPKLNLKNGYLFVDEVHEFSPLRSQSLEIERFCRHCRNKNIGFLMTSQRAAAVSKNTLALTDYLVVLRTTWTHDLQAIKDLISDISTKEETAEVISSLPTLGFLEGWTLDYRKKE